MQKILIVFAVFFCITAMPMSVYGHESAPDILEQIQKAREFLDTQTLRPLIEKVPRLSAAGRIYEGFVEKEHVILAVLDEDTLKLINIYRWDQAFSGFSKEEEIIASSTEGCLVWKIGGDGINRSYSVTCANFLDGSVNHVNAVKAMFCLLDTEFNALPDAIKKRFSKDPESVGVYIPLFYITGSENTKRYIDALGKERTRPLSYGIPPAVGREALSNEVWWFLRKYLEVMWRLEKSQIKEQLK